MSPMDQAVLTWFNQTAVHPGLDIVLAGITLLGLFFFLAAGFYYAYTDSRRFGPAIFLALFLAVRTGFVNREISKLAGGIIESGGQFRA